MFQIFRAVENPRVLLKDQPHGAQGVRCEVEDLHAVPRAFLEVR